MPLGVSTSSASSWPTGRLWWSPELMLSGTFYHSGGSCNVLHSPLSLHESPPIRCINAEIISHLATTFEALNQQLWIKGNALMFFSCSLWKLWPTTKQSKWFLSELGSSFPTFKKVLEIINTLNKSGLLWRLLNDPETRVITANLNPL